MPSITENLHVAFVTALGGAVAGHSSFGSKPLDIDLVLPHPPRLRIYAYTLVHGGPKRTNEFKAVLRVPRQPVGEYGYFDHSDGRLAAIVAYHSDLDVFVLWDASLHPRFKNGGNVQVRNTTVHAAAVKGRADQPRYLPTPGVTEVVIACQSKYLLQAVDDRVAWTGGFETTPVVTE